MKILGIDSSAKSASAAVIEKGKIVSSFYINTGLTHSQTLMPMLESVLKCAELSAEEIDLIAVNRGPGSFTGIRIGVAAAKGLADTQNIKTCGISTLESMAYNLLGYNCIAVSAMDARCSQVYTALFRVSGNNIERLTEDSAMSISDLGNLLMQYTDELILVGDGADLCFKTFKDDIPSLKVASESDKYQNAVGVCLAASQKQETEYSDGKNLVPEYLRLPQAERELKNRLKKVSD